MRYDFDMETIPQLLLTRVDVLNVIGISESTLYRLLRAGEFPAPVRLGGRAYRVKREIDAFVQSLENRKESK